MCVCATKVNNIILNGYCVKPISLFIAKWELDLLGLSHSSSYWLLSGSYVRFKPLCLGLSLLFLRLFIYSDPAGPLLLLLLLFCPFVQQNEFADLFTQITPQQNWNGRPEVTFTAFTATADRQRERKDQPVRRRASSLRCSQGGAWAFGDTSGAGSLEGQNNNKCLHHLQLWLWQSDYQCQNVLFPEVSWKSGEYW